MIINRYEESLIKNASLPQEWQSQSSLDELDAFLQANWEQRSVFYDDGQISSRQQFLVFTGQKGVKTQNYIGTIVFKGSQINIFPKVFREDKEDTDTSELSLKQMMYNLVRWIEYCGKIDYPFINITSGLDDSTDLRELFITLYLRFIKTAMDRSLFFQYEEITEECNAIKGKADYRDYYIHKYAGGRIDKLNCSYSTFEFDNALNRIIKYTCKELQKSTSTTSNQRLIRQILMKLTDVSDVRCVPHDCDNIRLSRLHKHYSIVLSMSKMFLLNKTSAYNVDNTESFCFLFPTELLFEGFIGGFMQSVLQGQAKVRLQASEESVFSDVIYGEQSLGKAMRMKHDILVEHKTKGLFILDTKYKMINRFEGSDDVKSIVSNEASSQDIYQVLTYARTRGLHDVYLLYPMFRYEDIEPVNPRGINKSAEGDNPINVYLVRLPFVFEEDEEKTKENLAKAIQRLF